MRRGVERVRMIVLRSQVRWRNEEEEEDVYRQDLGRISG